MSLHSPKNFSSNATPEVERKHVRTHTKGKLQEAAADVEAESTFRLKSWLKNHYELHVQFVKSDRELPHGNLEGYEGNRLDRLLYLQSLKKQIQKFPPELFKTLGLKTLKVSESITDRASQGALGGATPLMGNTFFLHGKDTWPFYHELFHRLEHVRLGGYINIKDMPADFMPMNNQLVSMRNNKEWVNLDPDYDRKNPIMLDEEQANYCYHLMNLDDPEIREGVYSEKMETEAGREKFAKMKEWLKEWSGGLLDESYWEDLEAGRVSEKYWTLSS